MQKKIDNQQKQHLFGKSIDGQFNCDFKTYKSNQNLFKIKYKVFSLLFFVFNWIVHTEYFINLITFEENAIWKRRNALFGFVSDGFP